MYTITVNTAQLRRYIFISYKTQKIKFWFGIRVIESFATIVLTYIFSQGIAALENTEPVSAVVQIFVTYTAVAVLSHFLRIASKTRLTFYNEVLLVKMQKELMVKLDPVDDLRKRTLQAVRNLTRSLRTFVIFMLDNGITGVVGFIAIPVLLYFIDTKIFYIEMLMIIMYLLLTYIFSFRYGKIYETYDSAREKYFSSFNLTNKVNRLAKSVITTEKSIEDYRFLTWFMLQSLISTFQLLIFIVVVHDVVNGTKQISELVLISGYTLESKTFLNSVTTGFEHLMEVNAGVRRVVAVSQKRVSSII